MKIVPNQNLKKMPQSINSYTTHKTVKKAVLPHSTYCLKDYQLEDGLLLRQMLIDELDAESVSCLLKANIKEDDYFFAYCPDNQTCKHLSAYYDINKEGPVKRFFYIETIKREPTSQKGIFVFIINYSWIKTNYNCSAASFAEFIDMLPVLFNLAQNPAFMKIDMFYYMKTIREITHNNEQVNIFRLRVNVLSLIEKFFSSANFSAFHNAATAKKYSYTKEMHDLSARLSMFLKSNLPDLIIFAREYNMSLSSLKRHFKNVHGKPIYEYYLEQKMMLARNIIQDTRRSVAQVAYELGYEDPNCLIKSFKKVYGVPPGKLCG